MMFRQYDRCVFFCAFQFLLNLKQNVGEMDVENNDNEYYNPSRNKIDE